jgi:RNA polymerase sigma factor (sigma-70 family)
MAIVAKYAGRYPYIVDDMVGAAMMGICQAVDWASTRVYDNNIMPYIYQTTERFVRDLIETRFVIQIPRKAFKALYEEQDAFIPMVQMVHAVKDDEDNYQDEYDLLTEQSAHTVEEHPILFEELIESLALSARDRIVVDMLIENYEQQEIAQLLGVSKMMITHIKKQIGDKLERLRYEDRGRGSDIAVNDA